MPLSKIRYFKCFLYILHHEHEKIQKKKIHHVRHVSILTCLICFSSMMEMLKSAGFNNFMKILHLHTQVITFFLITTSSAFKHDKKKFKEQQFIFWQYAYKLCLFFGKSKLLLGI